jgi:hypothetical protein
LSPFPIRPSTHRHARQSPDEDQFGDETDDPHAPGNQAERQDERRNDRVAEAALAYGRVATNQ